MMEIMFSIAIVAGIVLLWQIFALIGDCITDLSGKADEDRNQ